MNDELKTMEQQLLKDIHHYTSLNIQARRTHLHQVCIIAGAIAAFSMPVYALQSLPALQHSFVAIGIVAFLICIFLGMWRMNATLETEAKDLRDMRLSLEENDRTKYEAYVARREIHQKRWKHPDILGPVIAVLFSGGILCLIVALVLGEYGT